MVLDSIGPASYPAALGLAHDEARRDNVPMFFDTRPKVLVQVEQTGETYSCATTESLLQGMLRLGRRGIPVGCVNGGCGVCKVRVIEGRVELLGPLSRAHVTAEEEAAGLTLACRAAPQTAVKLAVAGKLEKPFVKWSACSADRRTPT